MVLNLILIQKVINPNSVAGLVTLQLWTHLIAPGLTSPGDLIPVVSPLSRNHEGNTTSVQAPCHSSSALSALSTGLIFQNTSTPPSCDSSGHDKLCRGNTPNTAAGRRELLSDSPLMSPEKLKNGKERTSSSSKGQRWDVNECTAHATNLFQYSSWNFHTSSGELST